MRYVVSDLHGELRLFDKMLEIIGFSNEDELYILGDIVDRGPEPFGIIDRIRGRKNIIKIMGNHELMMIEALTRGRTAMDCWLRNGGNVTLRLLNKMSLEKRQSYLNEIMSWPFYKVIDNFILVHAGYRVPRFEGENVEDMLNKQRLEDLVWSRDFYLNAGFKGYVTIFGHTPTPNIQRDLQEPASVPITIWHDKRYGDKIGIDCGACFKIGRLACLRLEDLKEFYVDAFTEER